MTARAWFGAGVAVGVAAVVGPLAWLLAVIVSDARRPIVVRSRPPERLPTL